MRLAALILLIVVLSTQQTLPSCNTQNNIRGADTRKTETRQVTIPVALKQAECSRGQCQSDQTWMPYSGCIPDFDGQLTFIDPMEQGYLLIQVNATVHGALSCSERCPASVIFLLGGGLIYYGVPPLPYRHGCNCSSCTNTFSVISSTKQPPQGWLDYKVGENNTLTLSHVPQQECLSYYCISSVQLNMTYLQPLPCLESATPLAGPKKGGTIVYIHGRFFDKQWVEDYVYCVIAGVKPSIATFVNANTFSCVTPKFEAPIGDADLPIVPLLVQASDYNYSFEFAYYDEAQIISLSPPSGHPNKELRITVTGTGFLSSNITQDNETIVLETVCYVNGDSVETIVLNSTRIICIFMGDNLNITEKSIPIYVSNNGQQYSNSLQFQVKRGGITIYVWIIVTVSIILFVSVIVLWQACRLRLERNAQFQGSAEQESFIPAGSSSSDPRYPEFANFVKQINSTEIKLLHKIGKGSFGEVFKGEWRKTIVAVKKLPAHKLTEEFFREFSREAMIMKSLRHPNILQFLGACTDPPDICIVMEFMPLGSLYRIIHDKTFSLEMHLIKRMMIDTARGMAYLHNSNPVIIHRDLKTHNLLVDENYKVKVCDFGLSRIYGERQSTTMTACGTPCWTAPEILRNNRYTESADVYSFAIVLWEMVSRSDPFSGMPPFQVIFAVGTQGARPTIPQHCNPDYQKLMEDCWQEEPANRPTFNDILDRLEKLGVAARAD
mmetsp:Transcript_20300/g.22563  ORF Transcript_20300/g.22563 Transcript_20300/m.22563 type:complete len:723 (+) Transcript_20300:44-2212(+)